MGKKGGRCMERSADDAKDNSMMINRILLQYRPIAPKPTGGGSVTVGSTPENNTVDVVNRRLKRKYVRVRKKRQYKKNTKSCAGSAADSKDELDNKVVTLQLLPERSNGKSFPARGSFHNLNRTVVADDQDDPPLWLKLKNAICGSNVTVAPMLAPAKVVESWVTVECVTDTWMDGEGLGQSDMEKIKNLEVDTCPGFISDGFDRVQWVNEAYKEMVSQQEDDRQWPEKCRVCLVMKEKLPYFYPAFACRVRLQYTWRDQKCSKTVPCDVWRMDFGGVFFHACVPVPGLWNSRRAFESRLLSG
ncbi:hypothetical protein F0562_004537 [Nyssa sinensis]|uniref:DUF7950 domain-containing protein n=1 Tax=Nyssa sinensis TaxID=561372 RepID=A0A5J5C2Q5_9ASTE|nr:hypothetical protein F0562_004537 [Nyssa sinensis]